MSDLLIEVRHHIGYITLNRPAALNSINLGMVRQMHATLKEWANDSEVAAVVVRGEGEKAFCAGGDIRTIYEHVLAGKNEHMIFFDEEFELNKYIYGYPKPYIALMDGYVMGGGMGISQGASHRVISERSKISMPEVGIGYFPDVGGSYFISRCPGAIGTYLGVTGIMAHGNDSIYAGLADWMLASEKFKIFQEKLEALNSKSISHDQINQILKDLDATTSGDGSHLASIRDLIELHFSHATIPKILRSLESEKRPEHQAWAEKTLETMRKRSPISMAATQVLIRLGKDLSMPDCFAMEFGLIPKWMKEGDFIEGVRALIVDKDHKPKWKHTSEELTSEFIDSLFSHVVRLSTK